MCEAAIYRITDIQDSAGHSRIFGVPSGDGGGPDDPNEGEGELGGDGSDEWQDDEEDPFAATENFLDEWAQHGFIIDSVVGRAAPNAKQATLNHIAVRENSKIMHLLSNGN